MTVREFQQQCELYPYSRESFELLKECKEIELQEAYLEQLRFLNEHKSEIDPMFESYIVESSTETYDKLYTELSMRRERLIPKIIDGMKRLFRYIANFFHKLAGNASNQFKEAEFLLKSLNELSGDDPKWSQIVDVTRTAANKSLRKLDRIMYFDNSIAPSCKFFSALERFGNNNPDKHISGIDAGNIILAVSNEELHFTQHNGTFGGSANTRGVLSPESIDEIYRSIKLTLDTGVFSDPLQGALAGKTIAKTNTVYGSFTIKFTAESFQKTSEKLNELPAMLEEFTDQMEADGPQLGVLYKQLNPIVSTTISVYTSISSYRNEAISALSNILRSGSAQPET